jgi:hypothetical protein
MGKSRLFQVLSKALRLPWYFGRNWDALEDLLRNLEWFPPGRVVLVHEALPELPPDQLEIYVDVLANCVDFWKAHEGHELVVVFSEADHARVNQLLPPETG